MAELIESIFTTSDIGEAEASVRKVYRRAELRDSRGDFAYEQVTRGSGGINFSRFKISSRMEIAVDFDAVAGFGVRLAGRYAIRSNRQAVDVNQPFLFTPGWGGSTSEDLDVLMVNIDVDVLTEAVARRLGMDSPKLVFSLNNPSSEAMSRHWLRTLGYAWNSVVNVPEVFHEEAIRAATFDAVTAAALAAFGIEAKTQRPSRDYAGSAAIRRAAAFIESNADRPLTVASIAEAARLSVRGLQLGFQREFGVTPMAFLRAVRLDAARADLLAADAADEHVAKIARRWAFANPGRFAALYRDRFGERPADTLHR